MQADIFYIYTHTNPYTHELEMKCYKLSGCAGSIFCRELLVALRLESCYILYFHLLTHPNFHWLCSEFISMSNSTYSFNITST